MKYKERELTDEELEITYWLIRQQVIEDEHRKSIVQKSGRRYVDHVAGVVERIFLVYAGYKNSVVLKRAIVGLLHDEIEDGYMTEAEVRSLVGDELCDAVKVLTKGEGEDYMEYIGRVKEHAIARSVKLCDIYNNLSGSPTKDQARKYSMAIVPLGMAEDKYMKENAKELKKH